MPHLLGVRVVVHVDCEQEANHTQQHNNDLVLGVHVHIAAGEALGGHIRLGEVALANTAARGLGGGAILE